MNFDSLKDQLRDQWNELLGKIQENSTYQTLKEKFDGLSLNAQRGILIGVAVLAVLFVLSFPYAYISSANENLATFEENRGLIRELFAASRLKNERSPLPAGLSFDVLKTQASSILTESRLMPEQIGDIQLLPGKPAGDLAPAVVEQTGASIALKNLTVRQVVEIGHKLQSLSQGVRIMSLDVVRSAKRTHYYDVVYKVVSFSLPSAEETLDEDGGRSARPVPGRRPLPGKGPNRQQDPPADSMEEDDEEASE